ncbi:zf-HC2 domain-containing protein [Geodermatophilus sp. SYSU D00758]
MNIPESHLAQEAITALVDGELSGGPAARAARHLGGCAQCRMAVEAQREAKETLHRASDVCIPGDLLSRLQAIPFTADVPGSGGGSLSAGPGQLTVSGASGSWSVPLDARRPEERPGQARWLRRGMTGALAGLGLGVTLMALSLPAGGAGDGGTPPSVARPSGDQRSEIVPPFAARVAGNGSAAPTPAAAAGGTP